MEPMTVSLIYLSVLLTWTSLYSWAGKSRKYTISREVFEQNRTFEIASKTIFLFGNILLVYSLWSDAPWLLKIVTGSSFLLAGIVLCFISTILLIWSMSILGKNYSPFFDSYKPFTIVTRGPYSHIRHPIYTANLLVGLGFCLLSGSLWFIIITVASNVEMIRAMVREEAFLKEKFPAYREYCQKTKRLFPKIY